MTCNGNRQLLLEHRLPAFYNIFLIRFISVQNGNSTQVVQKRFCQIMGKFRKAIARLNYSEVKF